ncbi:hypothetical protein LR48_Vigan04g189700 [Vigna angularis]|uniref:Uncharacterized protein n=1 Tax=Phaseolus angularis TaxID=3914 RepID=A0A0L9UGL6_PHAAN|nr:hypothetical protein LR48_Vigan04g189700 [Vigna angularis]
MDSGITQLAQARKILARPICPSVKVFVTEGSDSVCWGKSFILEKVKGKGFQATRAQTSRKKTSNCYF